MFMKDTKKGLWFKGEFCPVWGGLYCEVSNNPSFRSGARGIPNLSRAIKAEMHDAAVVVEEDDDERSDV